MSMEWLVLGALALACCFVLCLVLSVLGIAWFMITLPFRLLFFVIRLPFLLLGLAVAAVVIALLVFVPLAFLLTPALLVIAVAYGIWRLATRSRGKTMPA